jgi:hypothetical protein
MLDTCAKAAAITGAGHRRRSQSEPNPIVAPRRRVERRRGKVRRAVFGESPRVEVFDLPDHIGFRLGTVLFVLAGRMR